jgi:hypothetical protein
MAMATDYCTELHYFMHPPETILVLGTTFGPVPISEWDKEVEGAKELVAESAKGFHLPSPKVEIVRRDGDNLRPARER